MAEVQLSAFLREVACRRFAWGETDCVSTMLQWVERSTGRALRSELDYRWSSEAEALQNLAMGGGLVRGGLALMRAAGFERTDDPQSGDVGVVRVVRKRLIMRAAAICVGKAWAFTIEPGGLTVEPLKPLIAWRLPRGGMIA